MLPVHVLRVPGRSLVVVLVALSLSILVHRPTRPNLPTHLQAVLVVPDDNQPRVRVRKTQRSIPQKDQKLPEDHTS